MLIENQTEVKSKSFISESVKFASDINRPRSEMMISNTFNEDETRTVVEKAMELAMAKGAKIMEAPSTGQSQIATFTKQLTPLLARAAGKTMSLNNLIYVHPMSSHIAQLTYMRRLRGNNTGTIEALFRGINTNFGGAATPVHANTHDVFANVGDTDTTPADGIADNFAFATGLAISAAEQLGEAGQTAYDNVSVRMDRVTLTSESRKLKAVLSVEAIEDAFNEQNANILSEAMLTATGELERTIYSQVYSRILLEAKPMPLFNFNSVGADNAQNLPDKVQVLLYRLHQAAASIESETMEPGLRFNIITTPRIARLLKNVNRLYTPVSENVKASIDFNSFYQGSIGEFEIYSDPFFVSSGTTVGADDYICVTAKGTHSAAAPMIFGSYVPLAMSQVTEPDAFYNVVGFRSRYALITNPLATDTPGANNGGGVINGNRFARKFIVRGADI